MEVEVRLLLIFTFKLLLSMQDCLRKRFTSVTCALHSVAPLERVRGVRPHPRKFDSGCSASLLRMATLICESTFLIRNDLYKLIKP